MNSSLIAGMTIFVISLNLYAETSAEAVRCSTLFAMEGPSFGSLEESREILFFRRNPMEWPEYRDTRLPPEIVMDRGPRARGEPSLVGKIMGSVFNVVVREVRPIKTNLELRAGIKLGIVIGYHHLEKPWGRIFKDFFLKQVSFSPEQIVFIEVENRDVSTGLNSIRSDQEVDNAILSQGITHIFDVHEFFSMSDYYSESSAIKGLQQFKQRRFGAGRVQYSLVDAFVPVWIMESYYYENKVVPLLQHAINRHITILTTALQEADALLSKK